MRGFTLVELLVSLTLGLVLMAFLIGTLFATQQSNRQTQQLVQLQQNSQTLMSLFQAELPNLMFLPAAVWLMLHPRPISLRLYWGLCQ